MFEKVMKKVALVEVIKESIESLERVRSGYVSQKEYYEKCLIDENREEWWKENDKNCLEEYERKISAMDEVYNAILKLM